MTNPHPQLHITTNHAGPSTSTPPRRPLGARRRGVAPGLFVANPDNSDEEGSPPKSSSQSQRSPGSGSGVSPVSITSSSGRGGGSSNGHGKGNFNGSTIGHIPPSGSPTLSTKGRLPIPTIPAPQSSPLPSVSAFPSPQPQIPTPAPSTNPTTLSYGHPPEVSPVPPQPPPQPERHLRRAFTTPVPDLPQQPGRPSHEPRTASGSNVPREAPHSPSRALPPLPSPPVKASGPSPQTRSPSVASYPFLPHSSHLSSMTQNRVASPEDVLSPATGSEGGSTMSVGMTNRARSGSTQSHQVRLQVTTDNEAFHLVDITGINTSEGIREKVFSKLRIRDEDHPTLSMYRTEIGEPADDTPVPPAALLGICHTMGDSRASLKFLVKQTDVPPSSAASVIPPVAAQQDYTTYRSVADHRRAGMPPITTDLPHTLLNRPSSRHSKEGSMSSASGEYVERGGGLSASDWSDLGPEAEEWSGKRTRKIATGRSNGSSRSPITDPSASSPVLPTPPTTFIAPPAPRETSSLSSPASRHYDLNHPASPSVIEPFPKLQPRHAVNPALVSRSSSQQSHPGPFMANAGPSRPTNAGLGLSLDDDMDPETRALIEQLQREEQEAEAQEVERRRQLQLDEEFARKEQQSERDIWRMMQQMQEEQRQREQAQIAEDEARAREVQAEQQREEERRQAMDAARAAWEAEQREERESRFHTFDQDRRARQEYFRSRAQMGRPLDETATYHVPTVADNRPVSRLSENRLPPRQPSGPVPLRQNSGVNQPIYQSPPAQYSPEAPYAQSAPPRRPTGFPATPYQEASHAQDRLSDPRLQQVTGRNTPAPLSGGSLGSRGDPRLRHPMANPRNQSGDHLTAPSTVQGVRSMDNLRPFGPTGPASRPPYQGVPARTSMTPQPGGYPEHRGNLQTPAPGGYRSPSTDRIHDGRYPDPVHAGGPSRVPPIQIPSADTGILAFPSPHPNSAASTNWRNRQGFNTMPRSSRGPSWDDQEPPLSATRPNTVHYDRSPPPPTSPQTAMGIRRPSTYYDDFSPPSTARTPGIGAGYREVQTMPSPGVWGRPRSGSASATHRPTSPITDERRRVSESSAYADERDSQLPYNHPSTSPETSWLAVSNYGRSDTDTLSVAGTVSSESTVRPQKSSEDTDSNDTARAGMWEGHIRDMIGQMAGGSSGEGTVRPGDEEEATLWITAPVQPHDSPSSLSRSSAVRPSPSKPNLIVDTAATPVRAEGLTSVTTPSDSATESEGTGEGTGIRRGKSFARPKDPNQWNFRPEPELLYENLDRVFPKIDLDQPIVQGAGSTPTTPAADSPAKTEVPQSAPSQQFPRLHGVSPITETSRPPSTLASRSKFNKAENRRSIRVVADHKRRTLQREHHDVSEHLSGLRLDAAAQIRAEEEDDKKKVERRRSSMWDHKLVEVTPSRIAMGQVPSSIPESPAADGKPGTVNWVKGELIGKGSYGRVYIALNVTTGDMMAVKQVEMPVSERDRNDKRQLGMVKALRDEIELLKDLEHKNIVAYLGYETSEEYLSIFLEYVPGGTIASIYRTPHQARFEPQLVRFFTEQILEGLAYLHSKNIWHRDLKGDNILVDGQGICKISDFGISKQTADAYDSFGQATNMKGSVFWMAPEVIHSATERTYSGKVDIWSLGCVVLEMWSGKRPWGEMEQVAAMFELFNKRARPPLPPEIHLSDIALDFMNEKCLATDPRDRPMAKDLLQHPFILDRDENWTFAESKIGKAVAKRGAKRVQA
ncbi:hypothetical protein IAT40_004445 [Kwoniella sp. CBS 6097]